MRPYGTLQPTAFAELPPDTVMTFLLVAGTAQSQDWLSSGSTATANAGAAGAGIARFTFISTPGTSAVRGIINPSCTNASSNTSGTSIASSGVNIPVDGQRTIQVPGGSTGFSIFASTACFVMVEQWRK